MPQSAYPTTTVVRRRELPRELLDLARDPVGLVVQQRGKRMYVDGPPALLHDPAAGWAIAPQAIRAVRPREAVVVSTGSTTGRQLNHRARSTGKARRSTNRSLNSGRSESSTYSTSFSKVAAPARSRRDSSAIFAPSPATLPAETMRSTGSLGTRPIRTADAGER